MPTCEQEIESLKGIRQAVAAWLVGVTDRHFRNLDAPRNEDGTYDASKVVQWACEKAKPDPVSDDPLMSGSDSPNLERYRAARADLAEMDARERREQLVDIDTFTEWYASEVGHPIRKAIELLNLKFGPDAAAIMTRAIDKADAAVDKREATDD